MKVSIVCLGVAVLSMYLIGFGTAHPSYTLEYTMTSKDAHARAVAVTGGLGAIALAMNSALDKVLAGIAVPTPNGNDGDPGSGNPSDSDGQPGNGDNGKGFDPSKPKGQGKKKPKTRKCEPFGKFYQDSEDKKVWWSKDRSGGRGHGEGFHWKKFRRDGGNLIHEADVDMNGNVIDKHKGPVGTKIRLKDC